MEKAKTAVCIIEPLNMWPGYSMCGINLGGILKLMLFFHLQVSVINTVDTSHEDMIVCNIALLTNINGSNFMQFS